MGPNIVTRFFVRNSQKDSAFAQFHSQSLWLRLSSSCVFPIEFVFRICFFVLAKMLAKFSVIVVAFCIATIRADVSHIVGRGAAVDQHTIDILRQNISNYLVHLESDGNSQPMQLKHIYGATKQSVTSTIYTVQALLETAQGSQRCEIRVLEQPLFDFCQIRVKCENGGTYEVSLNQHGTHSHPFGLPDYVAPKQNRKFDNRIG